MLSMRAETFYDILELPPSASERDVKSAYRKKAMKLHPDVNKAVRTGDRQAARSMHAGRSGRSSNAA